MPALGHDALQPHLARMGENGGSVRFDVLVEPDAGSGLGQDGSERSLAHLKWVPPQVVTVELDEVEGVEEHALVVPAIADAIEARDAVVAAGDRLAVEDAGARAQAGEALDDEREALGQVIARPAVELDPLVDLASDNPEAVVLDLVQPPPRRKSAAGRWWEGTAR